MWYAKESAGGGQGLVIDEETGRNVALAYNVEDMPLLAASKDLLEACIEGLNRLSQFDPVGHDRSLWHNTTLGMMAYAIAKAEGRES